MNEKGSKTQNNTGVDCELKSRKEDAKMNELQIFNNPEFGNVRGVEINGEPWLVGKDVAVALGYSNTRDALARHVDTEDKNTVVNPDGNRGNPNMTIINESGLYSLVLSSKLPGAKKFRHWVTSEVLPSIRKHGAYIQPQTLEEMISSPEFGIRLLTEIKKEREMRHALEDKVERDRPKVEFFHQTGDSRGTVSIGDFAKILYERNKTEIGRNRLFEMLRRNGILDGKNLPYQKYLNAGWFEVIEIPNVHTGLMDKQTRVTGKGQQKLYERFFKSQV